MRAVIQCHVNHKLLSHKFELAQVIVFPYLEILTNVNFFTGLHTGKTELINLKFDKGICTQYNIIPALKLLGY